MKILMYSDGFGGATTTFIYNEVKYLSKKHDLLYICNKINEPLAFTYKNVTQIKYKPNKIFNKIKWWLWQSDKYLSFKDKTYASQLNKIIKDFQPDIIHCHFAYEALMLLDNLQDFSIPVTVHFHGYGVSEMLSKKTYVKKIKYYLNKNNIYPIIVSKYFIEKLNAYHVNTKKSLLLYCGININQFVNKDKQKNKNNFVFLQVSSLSEKKGHEYTLRAFAKFIQKEKDKNIKLILTGDGERKQHLILLVEKLNITQYIDFVGNVSHQKAKELMEKADVFIHHSITAKNGDTEGIPTAIMEAMAMELPIISTFHTGIPELVENGINGYLVKEKDIETYAKRMQDILTWGKIKQNRNKIEKYFEYIKHNEILENFYYKIKSLKKMPIL